MKISPRKHLAETAITPSRNSDTSSHLSMNSGTTFLKCRQAWGRQQSLLYVWYEKRSLLAGMSISATEKLEPHMVYMQIDNHGLENRNSAVAPVVPGGTGSAAFGATTSQSGAQHGVRRRTCQREDAGCGTCAPQSTTRYRETTHGVLSYSDQSPHLAHRMLRYPGVLNIAQEVAEILKTIRREIRDPLSVIISKRSGNYQLSRFNIRPR